LSYQIDRRFSVDAFVQHTDYSANSNPGVCCGGTIPDSKFFEGDKTVFSKKTVIDFSDVNIEGELTKPEGSYVKNRKKTRFRNLIEMRGDFRPELARSVNKL
jgi:hypothetical protein